MSHRRTGEFLMVREKGSSLRQCYCVMRTYLVRDLRRLLSFRARPGARVEEPRSPKIKNRLRIFEKKSSFVTTLRFDPALGRGA
jgi:hypothetical protein